jgi:hypothetical protein
VSASYFSPRSFTCLAEYGPQSGRVVNAGNAPYVAAKDLAKISKAIGPVTTTAQVVRPESLQGRDVKAIKQPYMTTFGVYQVSNSVAADFECDPDQAYDDQEKSRAAGTEGKKESYFAAVFRLKGAKSSSDIITLLWAKESKVWKIVAWQVEPAKGKPGATPDTRRGVSVAAARPPKEKVTADPAVLKATHDFLHTWLVNDDYDGASKYVSQSCNACVGLYLAEGEKPPNTQDEYAAYIRKTLNQVAQKVGKVQHLREALEPFRARRQDDETSCPI